MTINLTPPQASEAEQRAEKLGFASFAAYIAHLIETDLAEKKWILRNESGVYSVSPPTGEGNARASPNSAPPSEPKTGTNGS